MPKAICKKCNVSYPLQLLTNHIKSCSDIVVVEDENDTQDEVQHAAQVMECENEDNNKVKNNEQACCPICQEEMPFDILEVHASECGESPVDNDVNNTAEFSIMDNDVNNTAEFSIMDNDWKTHLDPKIAAFLYRKEIIRLHETGKPFFMCMDIRSSPEEQDRQLINFYKQRNVEWACPVKCQLQGDVAVGDGVSRHFFSTVLEKLKYGFSLNLGNTGVTCLFEGEPDHLVPSSSQFLIESDLFLVAGRMLGHSFLDGGPCLAGLSRAFVHVLLQGSQDTATLQLEDCPDVDIRETINLMLLSHISWPTESDNEDEEYSADTNERLTGYLRQFIETASAKDLKDLLKFWVGWDRMEANMAVEVVKSDLLKSSTYFCVLRLPYQSIFV